MRLVCKANSSCQCTDLKHTTCSGHRGLFNPVRFAVSTARWASENPISLSFLLALSSNGANARHSYISALLYLRCCSNKTPNLNIGNISSPPPPSHSPSCTQLTCWHSLRPLRHILPTLSLKRNASALGIFPRSTGS